MFTPCQGLTEEFCKLEELDLKDSSLTHIKLFPKLPSLKKLDISENRLSKGLEVGGRKGERGGGFIPEFHRQLDLLRVELEGATRVEMFGTFRVDLEDFFLDLRCGRPSLGPPGGATGR